ncbi:SDR family NAD(P)-dependent oxidoreductase [Oceanibacterium hippocampi]|uniref:3-oxoacyl-[acyl-carrier-protein] reductase FabG n=1 Tax=Oceanibacterium hippocampi TaxID=745714 RepID=A0A1Y5TJC9_9PROT|nr:SDR family NAD(P)-dependent oxidoreductase [Oceanibacterium hippocampi]SLN65324.1 3-oxoacyl-[acyl-carrier-protein] reductase FabG [Oceanibacterium hippocampi]
MKLRDQVAIVTGGAKGMGREITLALASEGAHVLLAARDATAIEAVADKVRAMGRHAASAVVDVTNPEQVRAMADEALGLPGGRIDILVNVAGIPGPIETPVQDVDPAAFDEVMQVNVTGTFLPIKYVVPTMIAQRYGKIVNIGSNSGTAGYPNRVGYAASKWAVRGITRTIAIELGPHNVNVNCINPGIVDGPRMQRLCHDRAAARGVSEEQIREEYAAAQAIRRITTARDVANAVLFLVGKEGQNITGQDIDIDGGWGI